MSERKKKITETMQAARDQLNNVLDQVGDNWDKQVYSDGLEWTIGQIVNHLADAERGHLYQVTTIAKGEVAIPEDFDIERYNKGVTKKTVDKAPEQARAELTEHRAQLNSWLATIDDATLDVEGRHASLQILSIETILFGMAGHEQGHAMDIAKALEIDV